MGLFLTEDRVTGQDSRLSLLMTEAAELRAKLGTADGITSAIRSLPDLTVAEARELILVLANRIDKIAGIDTDSICSLLDEAFAAPAPVETVYDPREHAAEDHQETLHQEMRDGVR